MKNLSNSFIEICSFFKIIVENETKESLRLKIEDKLEEYQGKLTSIVGINIIDEESMPEFTIPTELNNKIYKIKGLYNEYMDHFYN